MLEISLSFPKSETRLAGFPYGESVYAEQVSKVIDFDEDKLKIIFPMQIEKIASSFVQGFFSEIVSEIGYKGIEEKIIISACTESLIKSIRSNIY